MTKSLLAFLLIAIATLQVAFASYHSYNYCPRPYGPGYGGYSPYKSKYNVGHSIKYYCNKGYYLYSGSSSSKCIYSYSYKKAYWSHKPPVCKKISYCPKLSLYYGYVKHYGYTHGSKAYHYCNSCYKLYGDRVRVCKYGYWSGKAPVCKAIYCPKLYKPYYGKVSYHSTKCGSKAYYSCNYGYYLHGSKVRVCQKNGYWYGKPPKCIRRRRHYNKH